MKPLFLLILLVSQINFAYAENCISKDLFIPKYMVMNGGKENLDLAFNLLKPPKVAIKSGEPEFYMSAIKYRQHSPTQSKKFMQQSHDKGFFMSDAFFATAFYFGLFGYEKNDVKANQYFEQYLEHSKNCDEISDETGKPETVFALILKIFDVSKKTLNKKLHPTANASAE
jgi:hypothetical protein